MPEKKPPTRSFEAELRSLPVELIPPDPASPERSAKQSSQPAKPAGQPSSDSERNLVGKLIDRIKRI